MERRYEEGVREERHVEMIERRKMRGNGK